MNMPLVLLNRRRRGGPAAFSPTRLFALAEPGVWYDPSDVANLAWRRNLLTWTEQFDNAAWTKTNTTVTANSAAAPDGTTTADAVFETTTNGFHQAQQSLSVVSGGTYSVSAYVKANGRTRGAVTFVRDSGSFDGFSVNFNLSTETVSVSINATGTCTNSGIVSVGNGWYRVFGTGTIGSFTNGVAVVGIQNDAGAGSYAGDITKGLFVWGAQLELGSVATDYQRISDVNTEVIERFPSATLYQDTAGTQPVTTPGQTVALALDKSKGLVLGSELVTLSALTATSDWSFGGGVWTLASSTTNAQTLSSSPMVSGNTYRISVTVTALSSGTLTFRHPNSSTTIAGSPTITAAGTYTFYLQASGTTLWIRNSTTGQTATVSGFSVKELPGFHATQATLSSRPTYGIVPLGGRRNLLERTEEFDNAYWTKIASTITANSATAPNGTTTADKLVENALAAITPLVRRAITTTNADHTFTVYLKAAERQWARIVNATTGRAAYFDVANGVVGTVSAGAVASVTAVENGWYRCSFMDLATAASQTYDVRLALSDGGLGYTGDGTSGILIWGAQLETGSSATAYQRVGSAFDVTEAGVASLSYLSFDGVDDFLLTPTITPGIDKAQVFAGVRKLSDAATGVIAEYSANSGSNAGTWGLFSGGYAAGAAAYAVNLNGSQRTSFDATTFTAPISNVLTSTFDIAGAARADEIGVRVNGAVPTLTGGGNSNAGTGNFSAQAVYIGRKGGTSAPANMQLYSLLVRFGTNLDAGTITSTETWVNQRTGAYA